MSLHATVCRYDGVTGPADDVMRAGRLLASTLSRAPGFVAYALLDAGPGALLSINVFENPIELEAADQLVLSWAAHHLSTIAPHAPEVITGEVIVQRGM
jgi:hypothetical protein